MKPIQAPEWRHEQWNEANRRYEFKEESFTRLLSHYGVTSNKVKLNINGMTVDATLQEPIHWSPNEASPDVVATFKHQGRDMRVVMPLAEVSPKLVTIALPKPTKAPKQGDNS